MVFDVSLSLYLHGSSHACLFMAISTPCMSYPGYLHYMHVFAWISQAHACLLGVSFHD
jgi:hypothetical protein